MSGNDAAFLILTATVVLVIFGLLAHVFIGH